MHTLELCILLCIEYYIVEVLCRTRVICTVPSMHNIMDTTLEYAYDSYSRSSMHTIMHMCICILE